MRSILLLLALATPWVAAQPSSHSDPADPAAPVPAFHRESAFAGYRSFKDGPVASWKDINAATNARDPHAGHGKAPTDAPTATPAPAAQAPANPHAQHQGHGQNMDGEQPQ